MRISMATTALAVLAALAASPMPARAQTAPAAPAAPTVAVTWKNGLSVESPGGDNELQLGTLLQVDGRFALTDPAPVTDTFLLRRGRIILQGRVDRYFEFTVVPDFAGSTLTLLDAYVDTRWSRAFRVRTGKTKTPVGLEALYSDSTLPFAERSVANNLVPARDVGVTAQGDLFHAHVSYAGGVMNGTPDGTNGDTDANGGKDVVGRATLRVGPFGAAVGASHGKEAGALPGYKSTAQQTFFSYAAGSAAAGTRNRVSPSAFVYYKALGAYAEYFRTTQAIARGTVGAGVSNTGWNVTGLVVATGERATDRGVTPRAPFDPAKGQWGALQIAARAASLRVDPQAFALGLAAAGASRTATAFGISAVWYATGTVKHVLTYERTIFDRDPNGSRRAENALIFRAQISLAPSL
jgi:phosphate-selective porin OprO and OprP